MEALAVWEAERNIVWNHLTCLSKTGETKQDKYTLIKNGKYLYFYFSWYLNAYHLPSNPRVVWDCCLLTPKQQAVLITSSWGRCTAGNQSRQVNTSSAVMCLFCPGLVCIFCRNISTVNLLITRDKCETERPFSRPLHISTSLQGWW